MLSNQANHNSSQNRQSDRQQRTEVNPSNSHERQSGQRPMEARREAALEHQRKVAAAHAKREQQEASRTPRSSESLTHGAPRHSSRQQGDGGGRRQAPAPANMSSVS